MTTPSTSRLNAPTGPARGLGGRPLDIILALAVTGVLVAIISAGVGGDTESDAVTYLWAAGLGAVMLVRRRYPVLVLAVSVLGLFAYYSFGYPAIGVAVPVAAALFSAAEAGRLRWAIGAALLVVGASVFFRLAEGEAASLVIGYELAGHVLLMAAAIALGDGLRSRRRLVADARRIIALTAEDERRRTAESARIEREAIARDLHDALGHRTTVISLHADVAREALDRGDRAAADAALGIITDSSQAVLSELRRTVRLLRAPDEAHAPAESLSAVLESLPTLLVPGTELSTSVQLDAPLPGPVDAAAARIVQESAVNVVRHSRASRVEVTARIVEGVLELSVIDNGDAGPPASHGAGIVGMRERAEALGGHLTAGPENSGFAVRAVLPLAHDEEAR
ncbi:sensor histidine kinase [Brachybacterium sp. GCM10030252]|uniref:sensor histidine kinase n=1 Tax=Brachybacterium sp. GCM10030252 TaxID=3273380 RepID=UPI00361DFB5C